MSLPRLGLRGCGCCCCLLTAAVFVVVVIAKENYPQWSVVHLKRPSAICWVTSPLCPAVWGPFLYLGRYNRISTQPQYPELHCLACLLPPTPAPSYVGPCPLLLSSHGPGRRRDGAVAAGRGSDCNGMQWEWWSWWPGNTSLLWN